MFDRTAFDRVIARVRLRMRLQKVLEGAVRGMVWGGLPGLAVLIPWRLDMGDGFLHAAIASLLTGAVGGTVLGMFRPLPTSMVARALDRTHQLQDRVISAWSFLERAERGESGQRGQQGQGGQQGQASIGAFEAAAIRDGLRAVGIARARVAAPFRRPGDLRAVALLMIAAVGTLFVQPAPAENVVAHKPGIEIDPNDVLLGRLAAEEIARDETPEMADVREVAAALQELYQQLDEGLSAEEVLRKLAALEKRRRREPSAQNYDVDTDDARALRDALHGVGEALSHERPTEKAGDALQEDDSAKAQAALEQLAQAVQQEVMPQSDQRRLRRAMQQAARDVQRRLKRDRRDLQRLERDRAQSEQAQRQLERLQRELDSSGQQQLPPELAKALRELAGEIDQMQDEIRRLEAGERIEVAIADLAEAIRQAKRRQSGQSGAGEKGKGGKSGDKRQGEGRALGEFLGRAAGGKTTIVLGGGQGEMALPSVGGQSGTQGEGQGQGAGQGDRQDQGGQSANGIGSEHDPRLGNPSRLQTRLRDVRADSAQGAGPSRSETIRTASEGGFSTQTYKKVFRDYQPLVEEVLDEQEVEPGRRQQVKRYFELIRPRQ